VGLTSKPRAPWLFSSQALSAAPLAAAAAAGTTVVTYVTFFSGVGSYWNATTANEFTTALEGQYASVDPSSVTVTPVDFPVSMGVLLSGIHLFTFNSIHHLQDQLQDAIGQDAGLNGTSQVNLGAFLQTGAGLYLPFTLDNLGGDSAAAAAAINKLYPTELISPSSALSTTLATNGIQCQLQWAAPTAFPAGQADVPSTGIMLQTTVSLPNATMASEAVSVNMFDTGLLLQELAANGVTLGPLYGGTVIQTHTVTVTAPGGAPVPATIPAYYQVFVAPSSSDIMSAALPHSRGALAVALAAVAALAAVLA
jgi:hypothetical protein